MEPDFLNLELVLAIHRHQITKYGGSHGLRDQHLLESALGMPQSTFAGQFLHPGIDAMAAAYLYHLVKNHPFVDGNKRVAAMAALIFLRRNGRRLTADPDELAEVVLQVASNQMEKAALTRYIQEHSIDVV